MAVKVYRSTLTWRTLEYQDTALAEFISADAPVYTGEEDLSSLLRPTRRQSKDTLCMASVAVLAKEESKFKGLVKELGKRNFIIKSIEENFELDAKSNGKKLLEFWKDARTKGAAKVGGRISADLRIAETEAAIEFIREDWPKPSNEVSTEELKKRSGLSLNTIKKHLGKRPIAQYNYQAKMKRAAKKDEYKPMLHKKEITLKEARKIWPK